MLMSSTSVRKWGGARQGSRDELVKIGGLVVQVVVHHTWEVCEMLLVQVVGVWMLLLQKCVAAVSAVDAIMPGHYCCSKVVHVLLRCCHSQVHTQFCDTWLTSSDGRFHVVTNECQSQHDLMLLQKKKKSGIVYIMCGQAGFFFF